MIFVKKAKEIVHFWVVFLDKILRIYSYKATKNYKIRNFYKKQY